MLDEVIAKSNALAKASVAFDSEIKMEMQFKNQAIPSMPGMTTTIVRSVRSWRKGGYAREESRIQQKASFSGAGETEESLRIFRPDGTSTYQQATDTYLRRGRVGSTLADQLAPGSMPWSAQHIIDGLCASTPVVETGEMNGRRVVILSGEGKQPQDPPRGLTILSYRIRVIFDQETSMWSGFNGQSTYDNGTSSMETRYKNYRFEDIPDSLFHVPEDKIVDAP